LESCDLDTNRNATKNTHAKVTNVKQIYWIGTILELFWNFKSEGKSSV
jgi:hypothetical protein